MIRNVIGIILFLGKWGTTVRHISFHFFQPGFLLAGVWTGHDIRFICFVMGVLVKKITAYRSEKIMVDHRKTMKWNTENSRTMGWVRERMSNLCPTLDMSKIIDNQ